VKPSEWIKENIGVVLFYLVIGVGIVWWFVVSIPPKVDTVVSNINSESSTVEPNKVTEPVSDLNSNGCYSAEKAKDHKGEDACVDFLVGYTYESSSGNKFIDQYQDYSSGFIVYIPSSSSANNTDLSQFNNKNIKVTGLIADYYGSTEIIVTELSQIKIYR